MDADILIVGAGASGLSLAVRLSQLGVTRERSVLLLEPRTGYVRDRTWCYFDVVDHPFGEAATASWPRWRVAGEGREVTRSWPGLSYRHLPADAFYRSARDRLAADPRVELRTGTPVERLREDADGVTATTPAGPVRARLAFDSRPPARREAPPTGRDGRHAWLLQHFHGVVARTPDPVFEPGVATLMDFRVPQEGGIHFVYVLPFDERTALVEDTWFTGAPRPVPFYEASIRAWLEAHRGVREFETLHAETGAIPMDTRPRALAAGRRVLHLGARAGAARPSTGYAFLEIQRQADVLARALAAREADLLPRPPRPYSRRARFLDRTFVSYIERHPERAPELFVRMFERVRPDALARFLFDGGGWTDAVRVMGVLPALPLALESLRVTLPA